MKKRWICFALLLTALLFSGCGSRTVEEMYKIPRRSTEYNNLQAVIDYAMSGLEYAAPVSGENQQTVQMADLNGDGRDEYLIYAKGDFEKPLQILIFGQLDDGRYRLLDTISSNGNVFEQVEYVDVDGKPGCEIVVGRRLNNQLMRIASVYSYSDGFFDQILSAIYTKFFTCDLNADGKNELMIVRHGDSESNNAAAVMYSYHDGNVERSKEVDLSQRLENIRRIMVSKLQDGEPAVYIASTVNEDSIVTDILTVKDGKLTNIALSSESGTSIQTLRNYYVYSDDVDADGVLELPMLVSMKPIGTRKGTEKQYLIRWFSIDRDGVETDKLYTYHNFEAGWYLRLDKEWATQIATEQNGNTYTFFMWNDEFREAVSVFSLYTLTGNDRDLEAGVQNRFALNRGDQVVYAAKLEPGSAVYGITEDQLINGFRLIRMDWKSGET